VADWLDRDITCPYCRKKIFKIGNKVTVMTRDDWVIERSEYKSGSTGTIMGFGTLLVAPLIVISNGRMRLPNSNKNYYLDVEWDHSGITTPILRCLLI